MAVKAFVAARRGECQTYVANQFAANTVHPQAVGFCCCHSCLIVRVVLRGNCCWRSCVWSIFCMFPSFDLVGVKPLLVLLCVVTIRYILLVRPSSSEHVAGTAACDHDSVYHFVRLTVSRDHLWRGVGVGQRLVLAAKYYTWRLIRLMYANAPWYHFINALVFAIQVFSEHHIIEVGLTL